MQCLIATAYHIAVRLPSSALPNKTEGFSRRRASRLELLNGRTKTSASQLDELRNRKASRNVSTSSTGFMPRRSGYLGKIAWSEAALSVTLNLSSVLMRCPSVFCAEKANLATRSSTLSLARLVADSCTASPSGRLWFSRCPINAPRGGDSRRTCLARHKLSDVSLRPREEQSPTAFVLSSRRWS